MPIHFRIVRGTLASGNNKQAQAVEFLNAVIIPALGDYEECVGIDLMINDETGKFALETAWDVPMEEECPIGLAPDIDQLFAQLGGQAQQQELISALGELEYYSLAHRWSGPVAG